MANYDLSRESTPLSALPLRATQPPFHSIPNIHNFRSLSAFPLPNSRRVRTDLLFRSAEPSPITPAGHTALSALRITTVYDLRSADELEKNHLVTPVVNIPGTERVFVPVFGPNAPTDNGRRLRYYGEEGTQGFVKAYDEILTCGVEAYRAIFNHIRDTPQEALLVHCTAGKDRTGVLVALVLNLAGVGDEEVAEEYALTEVGLAVWLPRIVEALLKDPRLGGREENIRRMCSAKKEAMVEFLGLLRETYGGAEGYLREKLGFSERDVERIRANVVEEEMMVDEGDIK